MKNKNLPYLIGGGLLLLGVGGYFLYQYISDKKELKKSREEGQDDKTPKGQPTPKSSSNLSDSFPIKKGTFNNSNVVTLQKALGQDANKKPLVADGDWGNLTEGAMASYGLANKTIKDKKELDDIIFEISFGK